jgi:hypothetical protein
MARDYKIFISHSWKHSDDLKNLRELLNNRGYFNVEFQEASQDEPINSENAPYIKQALRNRIVSSDIVLAIAGVYATYSDWIEWELKTADRISKPIVGIVPWGQERVSSTVQNYSVIDVRWNTESIVNAIRDNAE